MGEAGYSMAPKHLKVTPLQNLEHSSRLSCRKECKLDTNSVSSNDSSTVFMETSETSQGVE